MTKAFSALQNEESTLIYCNLMRYLSCPPTLTYGECRETTHTLTRMLNLSYWKIVNIYTHELNENIIFNIQHLFSSLSPIFF